MRDDSPPRHRRERRPEITAPTLVVHGAADPFFPVGNAKALAEEIPAATLLVLDGVGAELPSRAHAEVATAVLAHGAVARWAPRAARRADPSRMGEA
jgi:pimeloyl-ACP methyl ester carboxylesterase